MLILNLGCGTKTSASGDVVNIDWSVMLRIRSNPLLNLCAPLILNGERLAKFKSLSSNMMVHDLANGIPFPDGSADVIYHSHVLEHLDRDVAVGFLRESARALKSGGILRIVVPDLEHCCKAYLAHIETCKQIGNSEIERHDAYIEPMLAMSVRREASGTSQQKPLRRFIENILLGDARKRGETHQWMYDRFNLESILRKSGFSTIVIQSFDSSLISGWTNFGLDQDDEGREYKPESLYIEAVRD